MRLGCLMLGALGVLISALVVSAADEQRVQDHLTRAREYVQAGKAEEASIELRNAVQLAPRNVEAHKALAEAYMALKDGQNAFREYQEVVSLDPTDGEARIQVATFYLLARRYQDALDHAEKAQELLPERFEPPAIIGRAKVGLKDRDGAVEAMGRAVELGPDKELLWVELSRLESMRGNPDRAAEVLKKGLVSIPPSTVLRVVLANVLAQQERFEEADRLMGEVENLSGGKLAVLKAVALYRLKRGDVAAAEALLLKALDQAGENPEEKLAALGELANFYSLIGDLPKARDTLQSVQELAPDHVLTLARLANLYLLEGDLKQAEPIIDRLMEKDPNDRNARLLKARADVSRGDLEGGTRALEEIVEEAPDSVNGNLFLGKAYAIKQQWTRARKAYLKVLEEVPNHFFAQLDLAKVDLEVGRTEEALELVGKVLKTRPNYLEALKVQAHALLMTGKAAEAEAIYRDFLKTDSENAVLRVRLGQTLEAQGREPEAFEQYRKARQLAPDALDPLLREMAGLARHGKKEEAVELAEQFLKKNGQSQPVLLALVLFQLDQRDVERADQYLERALAEGTDNPAVGEIEAQVRMAQGRVDDAIKALQRSLQAAPDRVPGLLMLAQLFEKTGKTTQAEATYSKVLGLDPEHPIAANNLAMLYLTDPGKQHEALRLAQLAVDRAPDSAFTLDTLGWVQYMMGSYELAARNFEAARRALPKHPEIAYHLGAAYAKLGKREEAIALLEEALNSPAKGDWAFDAGQQLRELKGEN